MSENQPACPQCSVVMTWRDLVYGDWTSGECKRCHAKATKVKVRGVFHRAVTLVTDRKGMTREVPVLFNRAARRDRSKPLKPIAEKPPKRTRAMRRQAARQKAAQAVAA